MRTRAALPSERQEAAGRERPQGCPRPRVVPPGPRGPLACGAAHSPPLLGHGADGAWVTHPSKAG